MKKNLLTLIVFPLFIGCVFSPTKKSQSNHHTDDVTAKAKKAGILYKEGENKIELPFDFREYQLWQDKYDMGEIDERSYFPAYFEDDSLLMEHYLKKWDSGNIIPDLYYNFITDRAETFILQCIGCHINKDIPSLIYQVATKNANGYIDGITCFKFIENHDWKEQSFTISKNLDITLYHNQLDSNGNILKQKVTAKYVINDEGKFIRVE